jgi:NAD(P) transhydrogenase subunit alpha
MGFLAVILAAVNIFGGFIVTQRMLAMFKKKERK